MQNLENKHIWIIGASSGIGAALAQEFHKQGVHLILSARRVDKLEALNQSLSGKHLICPLDIGDEQSVKATVRHVQEHCGKLDSVIFLAAIYSAHDGRSKSLAEIHKMIHINLGSAFNLVETTLPFFEKQGYGQIVLCASVAGYRGLPNGQPYCATKAALISYGESLKIELEPKNINVKIICPGFVKTPLTDKNDFPMPMMIEASSAAKAIVKGLQKKNFEIHFPKKFTFIMKILNLLPNWFYFIIARKMMRKSLPKKS